MEKITPIAERIGSYDILAKAHSNLAINFCVGIFTTHFLLDRVGAISWLDYDIPVNSDETS